MPKDAAEKQEKMEQFELLRKEMRGKGFSEEVCVVSILKANLLTLLIAAPIIGGGVLLYIHQWGGVDFGFSLPGALLFLLFYIVSIVVHELLHGLTWSLFCAHRWKSIRLGVLWEELTPYCHCKEPLNFGGYLLGGLMPVTVLGFGLFILALLSGHALLLAVALINIMGGGGDMIIACMLLRHRSALIFDHPTQCGFVAFSA